MTKSQRTIKSFIFGYLVVFTKTLHVTIKILLQQQMIIWLQNTMATCGGYKLNKFSTKLYSVNYVKLTKLKLNLYFDKGFSSFLWKTFWIISRKLSYTQTKNYFHSQENWQKAISRHSQKSDCFQLEKSD